MKTKKFLSLLLALAMVFAMSVSAFADDYERSITSADGLGNTDFTATANVVVPAIDVVVPNTAGTLFINPMGFKLKVEGGTVASAADKATADAQGATAAQKVSLSDQKIVSPTYLIRNLSPMALDVTVNPLATVANGAKALAVASSPDIAASTKNEVFIYAQFNSQGVELDENIDEVDDNGDPAYVPTVTKVDYPTAAGATVPDGLLAIPSKQAKEGTTVGTIPAGTDDDGTTSSGLMSMMFFGYVAGAPKSDWDSSDSLTITMAFTFKPHVDAPVVSAG